MRVRFLLIIILASLLQPCRAIITPTIKREVRAVWLTTLGGLDWPHTKVRDARSAEEQKRELCITLDKIQQANFNTVFFQTRIRSTVIYPSLLEPWDACLTGQPNKSPGYDPLAFAIEECHKRGLQLHAWVVAFPGHNFKTANALGKYAMQKRVPSLCIKTKDFWMLNPGMPGTADYLSDICKEIIHNYDVDGIHLDYIRYPEHSIHFNDEHTYRKYGNKLRRDEWRRRNVTHIVETIHDAIKSVKPWVWLSCSPVGKRDDLPRQSSRGWNAYRTVFQDAGMWLQNGIMDMLVPMMYFQAGNNFYPFALDWKECSNERPVVNGLAAYKLDSREGNWDLGIIEKEVRFSRSIQSGGQAYFRSQYITNNQKGVYNFLQHDFYKTPALTPAMTWQSPAQPRQPQNLRLIRDKSGYILTWDTVASSDTNSIRYNIYSSYDTPIDTDNGTCLMSTWQKATTYSIKLDISPNLLPCYAITAINRYGVESEPAYINTTTTQSAREPSVTGGQLELSADGRLLLPESDAQFILVNDVTQRTVMTSPYTRTLDLSHLPTGKYTIYALKKKGRYHLLGRFDKP